MRQAATVVALAEAPVPLMRTATEARRLPARESRTVRMKSPFETELRLILLTEVSPKIRSCRLVPKVTRMGRLGEVGEYGLNHIPAKNATCESGSEGSNPSLSAKCTEPLCSVFIFVEETRALLD